VLGVAVSVPFTKINPGLVSPLMLPPTV